MKDFLAIALIVGALLSLLFLANWYKEYVFNDGCIQRGGVPQYGVYFSLCLAPGVTR